MTKTKAGPISNDRLKSFIERIEKLIEERKAIQGDIKDVFSEAKGVGYDVKTMRKVIQLRDMDQADRDEQQALLDAYLHALGMIDRVEARAAAGESARQIAAAEGISKSTAHRVSQKMKGETGNAETGRPKAQVITPPEVAALPSMPAHNPETGEITETAAETPPGEVEGTADVPTAQPDDLANTSNDLALAIGLSEVQPTSAENAHVGGDQPEPRESASDVSGPAFSSDQLMRSESALKDAFEAAEARWNAIRSAA